METRRSLVSPAQPRPDRNPLSPPNPSSPPSPPSPSSPPRPALRPGRRVLIVAWRDVASPQAGGSELLVDQLAAGLVARGDQVTLLCGGPAAPHAYQVVRSGGPYSEFLRG